MEAASPSWARRIKATRCANPRAMPVHCPTPAPYRGAPLGVWKGAWALLAQQCPCLLTCLLLQQSDSCQSAGRWAEVDSSRSTARGAVGALRSGAPPAACTVLGQ
eukprot:2393190-Prymnesium_polylepis.1